MNAYFESSTEKALEIIKRKKCNKIILISSIGLDLSGKKFVETARKLLGFDIVVLFFSANEDHLKWLQSFPNALYTNDADFYTDYILNYNETGLLNLKNQIEKCYKIKLTFTKDFLEFPKFINKEEYKDLIFEEKSENFRKVIIKSASNEILRVDKNRNVFLEFLGGKELDPYFWYVTIIDDEITFYSNDSYLGVNEKGNKINGEPFMKRWKFEKINEDSYIFYYEDKQKTLTGNNDKIFLNVFNKNNMEQYFKLIDENYE